MDSAPSARAVSAVMALLRLVSTPSARVASALRSPIKPVTCPSVMLGMSAPTRLVPEITRPLASVVTLV